MHRQDFNTATSPDSVTPLDGEWLLAPDPDNVGREERWHDQALAAAVSARVPSIIQEFLPDYHGVAWYQRTFLAPARPGSSGHCLLDFRAVDYLADVWVNGMHVGGHEGGETPFRLDVTRAIREGASNLLTMRVLNPGAERIDGILLAETPHSNKTMAYQPGSGFNSGGILDSVRLLIVPEVRIEDVFVEADWQSGVVDARIECWNASGQSQNADFEITVSPASGGKAEVTLRSQAVLPPGLTVHQQQFALPAPGLWDLETPFLYRAAVRLRAEDSEDEQLVVFGFRGFQVSDGFFYLNGRRLFLRSTHTGNHCPIGQVLPPQQAPDLLRRDLLFAKASGFNMVRFIAGLPRPYQLDLCDEIGLLVYEECHAAWMLADSPKMAERFDASIAGMIRRDRSHPSVVVWGLLNETGDGPVFERAAASLPLVRSLDNTRLVILSSGRWDGRPNIGSVSNPGKGEWEHVWGGEASDAPPVTAEPLADRQILGYVAGAGDAHVYPLVPQTPEIDRFLRRLGQGAKPVFLSEYGIGSLLNAVSETRSYEQAGARPDLQDFSLIRSMAEQLAADWQRFGMEGVYPFVQDFLEDSQRHMCRQRLAGFNVIRANPQICGYNLTGMLDHGLTGEGMWQFWREWKPGALDCLQDGWAPLRWCLFVGALHGYTNRSLAIEAVLANEDRLGPGEYPVRFRICGPAGLAWETQILLRLPQPGEGRLGALAVPVMEEEVCLNTPPGHYQLVAEMERGGGPRGRARRFHLSEPVASSGAKFGVRLWGIDRAAQTWLEGCGVACTPFSGDKAADEPAVPDVLLVGRPPTDSPESWRALARTMAQGAVVVFLSPEGFRRDDNPVGWLPLETKGDCSEFHDWLYHKECVAKPHPIFQGLGSPGIMDWDYYGPVIPAAMFQGQNLSDDIAAAAFAVGYPLPGGYAAGVLVSSYPFGTGRFLLSSLRILENLDAHPAADRLLLNLIRYAASRMSRRPRAIPPDFTKTLKKIGYAA